MDIYQLALRPLLFNLLKTDPEWLHEQTVHTLDWLSQTNDRQPAKLVNHVLTQSLCLQDPRLEQTLFGLHFPNPLGLAAGFDKNGIAANIWSSFGFGFAELGTVTFVPQPGNPRPRLFRLPSDKAVLNRMGFNNDGAAAMAARLTQGQQELNLHIPIGINLGKSKVTPLEASANDYLNSFRLLKDLGDYFVVNVSSPNTPGLRSLQDATMLGAILDLLQQENKTQKPLFVKIAPDLEWEAIADIITLASTYQLAGLIATNTTIRRDILKTQIIEKTGNPVTEEAGGISGAPLCDRSTEVIRFIWQQTQGKLPIIGVGGIFTPEDAWEKITAGASLIQVYTGWIYEGPLMVRRILQGLLSKLEQSGLTSINAAIGLEAKVKN
ncbi:MULTISPECIES: quinone-dependent dihydroorotate dehydrogenase [unclassified Tolypothrix]|uniref:quinone-dependent dihydroorotate dehydrogenase n=1 Tax=unclassified Tolypothrix TaxID=2649714 RepID=UPI0005EAA480|nr:MULTISPECIES: quinone-dependent dihydroorotate dehydrogenase [unclassified Tolypothrix]BAY90484.1 dihydroorotate oxidase [Microchaete diplosiphon NIES-3275]EKF01094.1 dihydroorotate oxidase [Tolypothrix sp. PCC 7601]MBE9082200.1 quinone-dependent dihydroorotate dehydrogenase [Tolypothrix sp. LEGE 11397]UYD24649.1 quinone-dependent dihydroorotate dehydrogenase [Tolypothrix sp. PCC 7712]UYD33122.1 quinone-dependent dihydroorotate dehydrogenase [Tolypothrix sp. PCC 7601]